MTRRFQFSVTWMAIAALVIGTFFGGIATGRRCYEIENEWQLQEIRASVERTRHLEELAARRQAEKHFYWPPGFVKTSGPLTPEEMKAVLKNIEENKEL